MILTICKSCKTMHVQLVDRCKYCGSIFVVQRDVELTDYQKERIKNPKVRLVLGDN